MTHNDGTGDGESKRTFDAVGRRDVLKTTAAAAVAAGGLSGSASANDYEVIPAQGQTIDIGWGETWENKLIDFSTGNRITITAHSSNWTIRNIGFQGYNSDAGKYAIFGLSDQGGNTSVFENVYMGDGGAAGDGGETGNGHGITAVWVSPQHSGHIDFQNCNFQGWYDNAVYASAPGGSGGGTIHIDNCYAANCHVSHYRVATNGSQVTNSVVRCDNEFYDGRGVWAWSPGPIPVDNCVLDMNGNHYSFVAGAWSGGSDINVTNTSWDNGFWGGYTTDGGGSVNFQWGNDTNPSAYVPDGVPTSAVEAAGGGSDDDSIVGDDDAHYFEIAGGGEFYLEVDQEVEPDPEIAPYAEYGTHYGDDWVGFELTDTGETYWWYKHDIVELDITDDQTVWIDGEEYDPDGDGVIEDFERSSPLNEYGGSAGLFGTTGSAYEGGQALENASGSFGGVNSTSGLDTYPSRGDDVTVYFNNASGDNFVSFNLFSQAEADNPDRYSVGLSGVSGDFTLWRTENGSIDTLDSSAPSSTTSGWYRVEISTDSSTISADLYDDSSDTHLASVTASDSTFSSGGIGFRSAGNGEVFDYVVLDD